MKKYILILLVFASCIEPVDVEIEGNGSNLLVVEGSIDTEPGPHGIQLTRTAAYGKLVRFESGASVSIRDNEGNVTFLEETRDGVYQTDASFSGEIGKSYILQIETSDGTRYNSLPEELVAVADIDTMYAEQKFIPTENPLIDNTGLEVFVEFQDDPENQNNYLWETNGVYQINANPELYINPETGNVSPLDCCATCWTSEANTFPNIFRDNTSNGAKSKISVGFIQDDGVRFGDKYMIAVSQYSLTTDAYNFHQLVNQQLSIDGDIFDPPPATIRGNMINLDDPDKNVIGFFRVSDVRRDTLFLNRGQMVNPPSFSVIRGDCRNYKNGTTTRPDFWL